jgi:hypothetical protein
LLIVILTGCKKDSSQRTAVFLTPRKLFLRSDNQKYGLDLRYGKKLPRIQGSKCPGFRSPAVAKV